MLPKYLYKARTGNDQNFNNTEIHVLDDGLHELFVEPFETLVMICTRSASFFGNREFDPLFDNGHALGNKTKVSKSFLKGDGSDICSL